MRNDYIIVESVHVESVHVGSVHVYHCLLYIFHIKFQICQKALFLGVNVNIL